MISLKRQLVRRFRRLRNAVALKARNAGNAARDRSDWSTAANHYRRHLARWPDDFDIWIQLGHALRESGLGAEADAAYARAAQARPNDADLILHRGHLARRMGDPVKAQDFYRASFAVDGNVAARSEFHDPDIAPATTGQAGSLDALDDGVLTGWAVDAGRQGEAVDIEILKDEAVIATARTGLRRADVEAAGLATGACGFRIDLMDQVADGDVIWARTAQTHVPLSPGPITVKLLSPADAWLSRNADLSEEQRSIMVRDCTGDAHGQRLTVLIPLDGASAADTGRLLSDLQSQWCENWQAIWIAGPASRDDALSLIELSVRADLRIRLVRLEAPASPTAALNAGLGEIEGDSVVFVAPSQVLEPEAVHRLLDARRSGAGLVYADEAMFSGHCDMIDGFLLKPAYGRHHFLCSPYFLDLFCFDAALGQRIGRLDEDLAHPAALLAYVLKLLDVCDTVAHVPAVLSRRHRHPLGTRTSDEQQTVLQRHLKATKSKIIVAAGPMGQGFALSYPERKSSILVVIPTRDRMDLLRTCLESLWRTCEGANFEIVVVDHESTEPESLAYLDEIADRVTVLPHKGDFNFARINNRAVSARGGEHDLVLFLNNDIEAIGPGWMQRMASLALEPDVGVVGANLLYGNGAIQHSGVVVGLSGAADHAHRFAQLDDVKKSRTAIEQGVLCTREYSAVTAACMMMRLDLFRAAGGYDEGFAVGFNDTDLCLRIARAGYSILNDGTIDLYHHESATRSAGPHISHPRDAALFVARWRNIISVGDPFYSPLMSTARAHRPDRLTDTNHPTRMRPSRPVLHPLRQPRRTPSPADALLP